MSGLNIVEHNPIIMRKRDKPRKWKVIILNDDFTANDFIIHLLVTQFNKSYDAAGGILSEIHKQGNAVAGVYSFGVAETKLSMASMLARLSKQPLRVIMEPE